MHSMDVPRGLFDRRFGQHNEPAAESDARARPWAPDGRARPPAELLDNLRLRLSQLADNHPSAQRDRHAPGDWSASQDQREARDRGGPGDWAPGDWGGPAGRGAPRDWDATADWRAPDWYSRPEPDAWPGEVDTAERDVGSPADRPADQPSDAAGAEAGRFGGLADAIRAASRLNDAFPPSADGGLGVHGEASFFNGGQAEPYRPWFMSGEPSTPWWAADEGQ